MCLPKLLPIIVFSLLALCNGSYYACPPTSLCVPPSNCPLGNITFSAVDDLSNSSDHSYVCGVFKQCEGLICCNDPIDLPINYMPNKTHWCYSGQESNETYENGSVVQVYPYPGLEEVNRPPVNENSLSLCPSTSVCVKASACPQPYITFSFGLSSGNYSCGSRNDSSGHVCCMITSLGRSARSTRTKMEFMKQANQDNVQNYNRNRFQFFTVLEETSVDNSGKFAKLQKTFTPILGRSGQNQQKVNDWTCGRTLSIAKNLSRIYSPIGDRLANEGDYPWHVAILSSNYEYLCSGVVINERTVLTIAHCLHDEKYKYKSSEGLLVRVGDLDLKLDTELNPAFDVKVNFFVIHPKYEPINLVADIAILELSESLRNLHHVRPVCLPGGKYSPAINQCKVPGWGQFSKSKEQKNEFSYELRAASFYIIDKQQCQTSLRRVKELGAFFKLQDNVLCAKGYSNSDTCKGDGGSGLVCQGKDVFVLKGLVSYGVGCGFDLPGVYTDVEEYLDFINNYESYKKRYTSKGERDGTGKDYKVVRQDVSKKPTYDKPAYADSAYLEPEKKFYEPVQGGSEYDYAGEDSPNYVDSNYVPQEPSYVKPDYVPQEPTYIKPDYIRPNEPIYEDDYTGSDYLSQDRYHGDDNYAPNKPDYVEDYDGHYTPNGPNYADSDYVPIYEDTHKPGYVDSDYSDKPDYVEPDYSHRPGYVEPDYSHEPDYVEPDYSHRPGYVEPDYSHEPGYVEPDYSHRPDYVDPDYSHRPGHVEPDYSHKPDYVEPDYSRRPDYVADPYEYTGNPHKSDYSDREYDYSPLDYHTDEYTEREYFGESVYGKPNYHEYDDTPDYQREHDFYRPDHGEPDYDYLSHRPEHGEPGYDHLSHRPDHDSHSDIFERDRLYYGDSRGYSYLRTAGKYVKSPSLKKGYAGKSPAVFTDTLSAIMKNVEGGSESDVDNSKKIGSPISHLKKTA